MELGLIANAFGLVVQLSLPILVAALIAGAVGGFLRVAFSIDDEIIGYVAKVVAVGFLVYFFGPEAWDKLEVFTERLWNGTDIYT